MIENTYGILKRLEFVADILLNGHPKRVLDIGCGTGANLTAPLALRFPAIQFVGVDSDRVSIDFAKRENRAANVRYLHEAEANDLGTFDLVIASEVIEHVEDPVAFLGFIRNRLNPGGRVVLTLPNGLGPFEFASLVETAMHLTGIYRILRALKRRLRGQAQSSAPADTLAISPHINFLAYGQIRSLIANGGFNIVESRPRTFLCGFGFDQLMKSDRIINWNAAIAERIPAPMVSGWMFLLIADPAVAPLNVSYRRSAYARFRRFLNRKRWNLT